ncbi:hypothetical protein BgiBS90_011685 [Biomphalaria glabrata]|nr:hypothetical protein BgiBS90_011685 [Biomphalaria glabrata]
MSWPHPAFKNYSRLEAPYQLPALPGLRAPQPQTTLDFYNPAQIANGYYFSNPFAQSVDRLYSHCSIPQQVPPPIFLTHPEPVHYQLNTYTRLQTAFYLHNPRVLFHPRKELLSYPPSFYSEGYTSHMLLSIDMVARFPHLFNAYNVNSSYASIIDLYKNTLCEMDVNQQLSFIPLNCEISNPSISLNKEPPTKIVASDSQVTNGRRTNQFFTSGLTPQSESQVIRRRRSPQLSNSSTVPVHTDLQEIEGRKTNQPSTSNKPSSSHLASVQPSRSNQASVSTHSQVVGNQRENQPSRNNHESISTHSQVVGNQRENQPSRNNHESVLTHSQVVGNKRENQPSRNNHESVSTHSQVVGNQRENQPSRNNHESVSTHSQVVGNQRKNQPSRNNHESVSTHSQVVGNQRENQPSRSNKASVLTDSQVVGNQTENQPSRSNKASVLKHSQVVGNQRENQPSRSNQASVLKHSQVVGNKRQNQPSRNNHESVLTDSQVLGNQTENQPSRKNHASVLTHSKVVGNQRENQPSRNNHESVSTHSQVVGNQRENQPSRSNQASVLTDSQVVGNQTENQPSRSNKASVLKHSQVVGNQRENQPSRSNQASVLTDSQVVGNQTENQPSRSNKASVLKHSQVVGNKRQNQPSRNNHESVLTDSQVLGNQTENQPSRRSKASVLTQTHVASTQRENQPSRSNQATVLTQTHVASTQRENHHSRNNQASVLTDSQVVGNQRENQPSRNNQATVLTHSHVASNQRENQLSNCCLSVQQIPPKINRRKTCPVKRKLKENEAKLKTPTKKRLKMTELADTTTPLSSPRASSKFDNANAGLNGYSMPTLTEIHNFNENMKALPNSPATTQPMSPYPNILLQNESISNESYQYGSKGLHSPCGHPAYQSTHVNHCQDTMSRSAIKVRTTQSQSNYEKSTNSSNIRKCDNNNDYNVTDLGANFVGTLSKNLEVLSEQSKQMYAGYMQRDSATVNFSSSGQSVPNGMSHPMHERVKSQFLNPVEGERVKSQFLNPVEEERVKSQLLNPVEEERVKSQLLHTVEEERVKSQLLHPVEKERVKSQFLNPVEKERVKSQFLNPVEKERVKSQFLNPVEKERVKSQFLNPVEKERVKSQFLNPVEKERVKSQFLHTVEEERVKSQLLHPVEKERVKSQFLNPVEKERVKSQFLNPVEEERVKSQFLHTVEEERVKSLFLNPLEKERVKSQFLNPVEEERVKSLFLNPLEKERVKSEFLNPVEKERVKSQLLHPVEDKVETYKQPDTDPNKIVYDYNYNVALDLSSSSSIKRTNVVQASESTSQAKDRCEDVKSLVSDLSLAPHLGSNLPLVEQEQTNDLSTISADSVPCHEGMSDNVPCSEGMSDNVPCHEGMSDNVPCYEGMSDNVPCSEGMSDNVPCYKGMSDNIPCYEGMSDNVPCSEGMSNDAESKSASFQPITMEREPVKTEEMTPTNHGLESESNNDNHHIINEVVSVSLLDQEGVHIKEDCIDSGKNTEQCKENRNTNPSINSTAVSSSHRSPTLCLENLASCSQAGPGQYHFNQSTGFTASLFNDIQNSSLQSLENACRDPHQPRQSDCDQQSSSKNSNPFTNHFLPYNTNEFEWYKGDKLNYTENSLASSGDTFCNSRRLYIDTQYDDIQYDSPEEIEVYPRLINVNKTKDCDISCDKMSENDSKSSVVRTNSIVSYENDFISNNLSPPTQASSSQEENGLEKTDQVDGQEEIQSLQGTDLYQDTNLQCSAGSDKRISVMSSTTSDFDSKWEIIYSSGASYNPNHTESTLSAPSYSTQLSAAQRDKPDNLTNDNSKSGVYWHEMERSPSNNFAAPWDIIYNSESTVNRNGQVFQAATEIDNQSSHLDNHEHQGNMPIEENASDHQRLDPGSQSSAPLNCAIQYNSGRMTGHTSASIQTGDPSLMLGSQENAGTEWSSNEESTQLNLVSTVNSRHVDREQTENPLNLRSEPVNYQTKTRADNQGGQASNQKDHQCEPFFTGTLTRRTKYEKKQEDNKNVNTPENQMRSASFKQVPPLESVDDCPPTLEDESKKINCPAADDCPLSPPILENESLRTNERIANMRNVGKACGSRDAASLEKPVQLKTEHRSKQTKLNAKIDPKIMNQKSIRSDTTYLSRGKQMLRKSQEQTITQRYKSINKPNNSSTSTFKNPAVSLNHNKKTLRALKKPRPLYQSSFQVLDLRHTSKRKSCLGFIVTELKHFMPVDSQISFKAQIIYNFLVIKLEDISQLYKPLVAQMLLTAPKGTATNQMSSQSSSSSVRITAVNGPAGNAIPVVTKLRCDTCGFYYSCAMMQHIDSDRHQQFTKKPGFYASLDELISTLNSVDQMVQKLKTLGSSFHENNGTTSQDSSSENKENVLPYQSDNENIATSNQIVATRKHCSKY